MAIYTNEHLTDLLNDEYEKVRKLEQELQRLKSNFAGYENFQMEKQLKQELELIKLERDEFKKYSTMWFDKKNELEQELQKTKEKLNIAEAALNKYAICDDVGSIARRYFKDKQGE